MLLNKIKKPSRLSLFKKRPKSSKNSFKKAFLKQKNSVRNKIWLKKSAKLRLHSSFRRSYKEEYRRDLVAPGYLRHALSTLRLFLKQWRLFLPFIFLIVFMNLILVGLMSQEAYKDYQTEIDASIKDSGMSRINAVARASVILISTVATGGLNTGSTEVKQVFAVLIFIITWLVTIYLLRHILAGRKPSLRDGLYNALTPLISSLFVAFIIFLHALPVIFFVIIYSSAVATDFLATPFYACLFWLFGALLLLLSAYLLPGSILGLVAVSAPGMYPMLAVNTASDLMQGRRIKFILRIIFAVFFMAFFWIVIMVPIILLDQWLKSFVTWLAPVPFVSFCLALMTAMSVIYFTGYIYLFYRRMLDDPN